MRFRFSILTLLFFLPAFAADFTPLSIPEMSRRSDLIVRATVESKSIRKDEGGRIFTEVKLAVKEVWKGDPKSPLLTVVHGGGILGERKTVALGQVNYEPGEELIGFYVWNPRGEAVTLGMSQGKIRVGAQAKIDDVKTRVREALK